MWEIILETVLDALKTFPFLLGVYCLIECAEHRQNNFGEGLAKYGVIGGALLGCFPQCGFSVVAAGLYSRGMITVGTLLAVFLSTSDEALPLLISRPEQAGSLAAVIGCKVIIAAAAGWAVDFCMGKRNSGCLSAGKSANGSSGVSASKTAGVSAGEAADSVADEPTGEHCECEGRGSTEDILREQCTCDSSGKHIFLTALNHTLKIFLFIVVISLILNTTLYFIGEEALNRMLVSDSPFQAAATSLIGLIPNCLPSVLLTELFISGNIAFGSLMAGLLTGAGLGLLMLFKANRSMRQNISIALLLYGIGTAAGVLLNWFGV